MTYEQWRQQAAKRGDFRSPSQPLDQLPIGYIDAEQLRRWDRLRGTEFESKERCYMPWSATPFVSDITDCSLPVFANPMPIPTPTQHKSLANLNKLLVETDSEAWCYVKNFILLRPDIPPFSPSQQEAADRITELEAELTEWEKLKDPINLHVNLLRGVPCRLDRMQHLLHLAGATDYDDLKAANAKMKACLEAIAEHHDELSIYPTMPDGEPAQDQYHTERMNFAREGLK